MSDVQATLKDLHAKMLVEKAGHLAAVDQLTSMIETAEAMMSLKPGQSAVAAPKKRGRPKGSKNTPGPKPGAKKGKPGPKPGAKRGPKKAAATAKPSKNAKFTSDTSIEEADLPPRVVKLCEANSITTLAELAEHNIPDLVDGVPRMGVGAVEALKSALLQAGLTPKLDSANGASAEA